LKPTKEELINLYVEKNLTDKEIAKIFSEIALYL